MSAVSRSSTDCIDERQRLSFWMRGSTEIGGVDARVLGSGAFDGVVATRHLGSLIVFDLAASPHRAAWTRDLIEKADRGSIRLRFQRQGRSYLEQDGVRTPISAGQWSVLDGTRPYTMFNEEWARHISLQIPLSELSNREFEIARRLRGPFPVAGSICHLLFHCLRLTIDDLHEERDTTDGDLGESLLDMFRIMLNDQTQDRSRKTMRETAEGRIRAYIRRNLTDPDLSVETIASAMKCSRRYVHKLFEGQETVTQFIWSQRLDRCRSRMLEARANPLTLTELAFENGFRSSAHFSRAFRARYGMTPSAFRASLEGGGGLEREADSDVRTSIANSAAAVAAF